MLMAARSSRSAHPPTDGIRNLPTSALRGFEVAEACRAGSMAHHRHHLTE